MKFLTTLLLITLLPVHALHGEKPEYIVARKKAIDVSLTPAKPIPDAWLQERIQAAQVVRETEELWAKEAKNVSHENASDKKHERDNRLETRDVFLDHLNDPASELYRFDGGPGKASGYVIFKNKKTFRWFVMAEHTKPATPSGAGKS
jgi:hypothetical protein